jgi:hypothetical protein
VQSASINATLAKPALSTGAGAPVLSIAAGDGETGGSAAADTPSLRAAEAGLAADTEGDLRGRGAGAAASAAAAAAAAASLSASSGGEPPAASRAAASLNIKQL